MLSRKNLLVDSRDPSFLEENRKKASLTWTGASNSRTKKIRQKGPQRPNSKRMAHRRGRRIGIGADPIETGKKELISGLSKSMR